MIYFATDHRGFALKEELKRYVRDELGYRVEDAGAFEYNANDDYPDFIRKAAEAVSKNPTEDKAVILGASGQGEAIVANRHKNVRAVVYYGGSHEIITLARQHNDANILSLGAAFLNDAEAKAAVLLWLQTPFTDDDRHVRRIEKIDTPPSQ